MTAPNLSPWDDPAGAHRPGTDDFDGAAYQDDPGDAPDPGTHVTSAVINTFLRAVISLGKVVANARIGVRYVSGNPVLDAATAAPSGPTSATWTVARTGGGASSGDITISWPAGTLPPSTGQPTATVNVAGAPAAWNISATNVTNGVRVITAVGGTATDLAFTVSIP